MPPKKPVIRPLTAEPPATFQHRELWPLVNNALNSLRRNQSLKTEADRDFAKKFQNIRIPWQQVTPDYDIAAYWSNQEKKRSQGDEHYYINLHLDLSPVNANYTPTQFKEALDLLETKIRDKKRTNPDFNDLLFMELHLASCKLAALIMSNRDKLQFENVEIPPPIIDEINLLTEILTLTIQLLDKQKTADFMKTVASLENLINNHINHYNNLQYVKNYHNIEPVLKKLQIHRYISVTLICIFALSAPVCLVLVHPAVGAALLGAALGLFCAFVYNLLRAFKIESSIGDNVKLIMERTEDRQAAIGGLFKAVKDAPSKMVDNEDKEETPTTSP